MAFFFTQLNVIQVVACINSLFLFITKEYSAQACLRTPQNSTRVAQTSKSLAQGSVNVSSSFLAADSDVLLKMDTSLRQRSPRPMNSTPPQFVFLLDKPYGQSASSPLLPFRAKDSKVQRGEEENIRPQVLDAEPGAPFHCPVPASGQALQATPGGQSPAWPWGNLCSAHQLGNWAPYQAGESPLSTNRVAAGTQRW